MKGREGGLGTFNREKGWVVEERRVSSEEESMVV